MHIGFVGRHTAIAVCNLQSNISRLGGAAGSSREGIYGGRGIYDVMFIKSLCRMFRLILSAKCVVANKHSAGAKGGILMSKPLNEIEAG